MTATAEAFPEEWRKRNQLRCHRGLEVLHNEAERGQGRAVLALLWALLVPPAMPGGIGDIPGGTRAGLGVGRWLRSRAGAVPWEAQGGVRCVISLSVQVRTRIFAASTELRFSVPAARFFPSARAVPSLCWRWGWDGDTAPAGRGG